MADTAPTLGYGNRSEADIDQVNQWMRSQPWYTQLFSSWGVSPDSHPKLTDTQKQQIIKAAQANGIVVDEGHNGQDVDDTGNFEAKSHLGRNIAIAAGIAGAVLLTAGAAGAFAGAAAPSLAGVEGLPAGLSSGALSSLGSAAVPLGAVGAPAAAAAGAAVPLSGIASAAAPLEAASFPGAAAVTAGGAAAAPAAAAGGVFDAAGNFVGTSTAIPEAAAGGSGVLKGAGSFGAFSNPLTDAVLGGTSLLQYLGGKNAANAAKDAAAIQSASVDKALATTAASTNQALDYTKQQYGSAEQNLSPFIQSGQWANKYLASLMGAPVSIFGGGPTTPQAQNNGLTAQPPGPGTMPQPNTTSAGYAATAAPARPTSPMPSVGPATASLAASGQTPLSQISAPTAGRSAPMTGGEGLVKMRAPNGQMQAVPAAQVQHYQSLGAQVVA